jgi:hypothetical protein
VDIWDGLRIVLRRWKVAVPIFLVFLVAAFVGGGMIAGEYKADASVILLGPNQQAAGDTLDPNVASNDVNAYLTGCSTCETVARATQLALLASPTRSSIAEEGLSTDYSIVVENRSPIMLISVSDGSGSGATDTLQGIIDRINQELEARQTDVNAPTDQRITANVLAQDEEASTNFGGRSRVRLALMAVGAAAAVAAAFIVEGVIFKRKRPEGEDGDEGSYYGDDDDEGGSHRPRHGSHSSASGQAPAYPDYNMPPPPGSGSSTPDYGGGKDYGSKDYDSIPAAPTSPYSSSPH